MNVIERPQGFTLNLFLRDGVDAASAMWYNEYHTIINCGYDENELTTFFFNEFDLNIPEDGIYTMENFFRENPDLCRTFVKASIEGWLYAFAHEDETLDMVMKYANKANLPTNRVHQRWMLRRMKDITLPQDVSAPMGSFQEKDFNTATQELKNCGIIDTIPNVKDFYVR